MRFKRTQIAKELFDISDNAQKKLINLVVEILKREKVGKNGEKQSILYSDEELEKLRKIVGFLLFVQSKECPNFRTIKETENLIKNILNSLNKKQPFLIFALFCPSYKKIKEVVGFNIKIGETTKKGINNLSILSKKAESLGIKTETYAIYSDLALENSEKLNKKDLKDLEENYLNFVSYGKKINSKIRFRKISQVGNCKQFVKIEGIQLANPQISSKKINSIVNRSKPLYKDVLGWNNEDILKRTKVLANSCLVMGREVKAKNPNCMMIIAENMYERGSFYNSEKSKDRLPIFYPHKTQTKIDEIALK
jgi:hypothetical protein